MPPSEHNPSNDARPRILLVDDEPELVDAYVRLLGRSGFECRGALDIERAASLLESGQYDLMITDLSLPRSSGLDIIRRAQRRIPHVPVIVMTGHSTPDSAKAAEEAGADACLLKPVSIAELVRVIHETLARHGERSIN